MRACTLGCTKRTRQLAIDNDVSLSNPHTFDGSRADRASRADDVPAFADDIGVGEPPERARQLIGRTLCGLVGQHHVSTGCSRTLVVSAFRRTTSVVSAFGRTVTPSSDSSPTNDR